MLCYRLGTRIRCNEHGVKQITVPWARKGSKFTILFEQTAILLVRKIPVLTTARILEMNDKRLWRIIRYYVNKALSQLNFIDLDRKGMATLNEFKKFLVLHQGKAENVVEVVSDMSGAFISGIKTHFTNSAITIDWFHVVQLFSKAADEVRRKEAKEVSMPKATRWATLKASESKLTENQINALAELDAIDLSTAEA